MRYFRLMEFSIKTLSPETAETGCIVLGIYGGNAASKELTASARRVDQRSKGALAAALTDLASKVGSTLLLRALPNVAAERVLLVSLGARNEFGETQYRDAVRGAASALRDLAAKEAALFLVDVKLDSRPLSWNVRHAVLNVREAFYRFDELKSQKKSTAATLAKVTLPLSSNAQLEQAL